MTSFQYIVKIAFQTKLPLHNNQYLRKKWKRSIHRQVYGIQYTDNESWLYLSTKIDRRVFEKIQLYSQCCDVSLPSRKLYQTGMSALWWSCDVIERWLDHWFSSTSPDALFSCPKESSCFPYVWFWAIFYLFDFWNPDEPLQWYMSTAMHETETRLFSQIGSRM